MDSFRAWAEVDLDALASNLRAVRREAGPGVRVMLVVKQDAYGHGAIAVSHHALRCGVGALGVGSSTEALELRRAGIRAPILILGTVVEEELFSCLRHEIHVGLHSLDRAHSLQDAAGRMGLVAGVHLNVDTGMGRLGVCPSRALDLLRQVRSSPNVHLEGIMTHLAPSDGARNPMAARQLDTFDRFLAEAEAQGLREGWVHAANSAGLFTGLGGVDRGYDTIRVGIAAYGALPPGLAPDRNLRPVMSLRTRVVFLKDLEAGAPVGYDSTWRSPRRTRIATLPIGYGHGLPWSIDGWQALVRGERAPLVGRLSMDYATIDVGQIPGIEVGQEVTLLGADGHRELRLEDLARKAGSIPHELTCALGKLPRLYRGGGDLLLPGQTPAAVVRSGVGERVPGAI